MKMETKTMLQMCIYIVFITSVYPQVVFGSTVHRAAVDEEIVETVEATGVPSHSSATATPGSPQLHQHENDLSHKYDNFIEGLRKLVAALGDPEYDWDAHKLTTPLMYESSLSPDPSPLSESSPTPYPEDPLALSKPLHPLDFLTTVYTTMKILGQQIQHAREIENALNEITRESGRPGIVIGGQVYESVEEYQALTFSNHTASPQPSPPHNGTTDLNSAVQILSNIYQLYYNSSAQRPKSEDGLQALIETFEALARMQEKIYHGNYIMACNLALGLPSNFAEYPSEASSTIQNAIDNDQSHSSDLVHYPNDVSETEQSAHDDAHSHSFDLVHVASDTSVQSAHINTQSLSSDLVQRPNEASETDQIAQNITHSLSSDLVQYPNEDSETDHPSEHVHMPPVTSESSENCYIELLRIIELMKKIVKLDSAASIHASSLPPSPPQLPPPPPSMSSSLPLQSQPPSPTTTTTTPTNTTTTRAPLSIPYTCNRPFEEIAYRMCILQEVNMRLSWQGAQDYCQERGAMLAYDSVVVKARRFFNDLYGEEGSRVRWPFWIGGKKDVDWKWQNGSPVPSFLWASEQPRSYPPVLAPQGTCMIIDGYQEFYGASLPCHLKRRFVCQIPG